MMFLVVLSALAAISSAQYNQNNYQHQNNNNNNSPAPVHYVNVGPQLQGDYKFGYNTGNGGSFREETRNPDGSVSGAYGYIDGSGQQKIIRYTAGKDGFKAEGDDIPKAPAVPQQPAPQASYNPAPQQYYNPQPANNQHYNPQPAHNQHYAPSPSYSNNYVQSAPQQQQHYSNQQYNNQQYNGQQGSYNPFAYIPAQTNPGQFQAAPSQLSYNIGTGGNSNHYQG